VNAPRTSWVIASASARSRAWTSASGLTRANSLARLLAQHEPHARIDGLIGASAAGSEA
jgi:hypothetical protein